MPFVLHSFTNFFNKVDLPEPGLPFIKYLLETFSVKLSTKLTAPLGVDPPKNLSFITAVLLKLLFPISLSITFIVN